MPSIQASQAIDKSFFLEECHGAPSDPAVISLKSGESKLLSLRFLKRIGRSNVTINSYHPNFRDYQRLKIDFRSIYVRDDTQVVVVSSDKGEIRVFPAIDIFCPAYSSSVSSGSPSGYEFNGVQFKLDGQLPCGLVDLTKLQDEPTNFVYYPCDVNTVKIPVDIFFRNLLLFVWAGANEDSAANHVASVLSTLGIQNVAIKPALLKHIGVYGLRMARYAQSKLRQSDSYRAALDNTRNNHYLQYRFSLSVLQLVVRYVESNEFGVLSGSEASSLSLDCCERFLQSLTTGIVSHVSLRLRKDKVRWPEAGALESIPDRMRPLPTLPIGLVADDTPTLDLNAALLLARAKACGDVHENMKAIVSCLELLVNTEGNDRSQHDFKSLLSLYKGSRLITSSGIHSSESWLINHFLLKRDQGNRRVFSLSSECHAVVLDFHVDDERRSKVKVSNSGFIGWGEHAALAYGLHLHAHTDDGRWSTKRCNSVTFDISRFAGDQRLAESFTSELMFAVKSNNFNQLYAFLSKCGSAENSLFVQSVQKDEDCSMEAPLSHMHDSVDHFESHLKAKAQLLVCSINTMYAVAPRDFSSFIVGVEHDKLNSDVLKFYCQRCKDGLALTHADMAKIAGDVTRPMFHRLESCIARINQGAERKYLNS